MNYLGPSFFSAGLARTSRNPHFTQKIACGLGRPSEIEARRFLEALLARRESQVKKKLTYKIRFLVAGDAVKTWLKFVLLF